jgi:hypothetical protein
LALISKESSAINVQRQRGFVSADDFSGAGEGGTIPQVTDEVPDNEPLPQDDIAQGELLSRNAAVDEISAKVKTQQMTQALNLAKEKAEQAKKAAEQAVLAAAKERESHINRFTGLVDMPDGS